MTNSFVVIAAFLIQGLCFSLLPYLNRQMALVIGENTFQYLQGIGSPKTGFSMRVEEVGQDYVFTYNFRDHQGNATSWTWKYDKNIVDKLASSYGVPLDFYEPYVVTNEVLAERERIMKEALFYEDDDYLLPHYPSIVAAHKDFCKRIYDLAEAHLQEKASFQSRVELILRFCQDITYSVPPSEWNGKIIAGLFPPSILLKAGWGDCDSKAMLFCSILANNPIYEIVGVHVPGHLYLAIKGVPQAYQATITYKGEEYIVCEPVGPARLELGKKSQYYAAPIKKIEEITAKVKN